MRKFLFLILFLILISSLIFVTEAKAGTGDNVSGWAWSENIGWISFNCNNSELPTPRCTNNYGVNINSSTGVFSGDAWSENIGWISFNESDLAGCPTSPCQAKLDLITNKVSGWARALTDGSGWDGWIHLRNDSKNYGVSWNSLTAQMEGWAWSDQVIGWLSFNCKNTAGACDTSNYKVIYGVADVTGPTISIIAAPASVTTTWQNTDATATVSCTDSGTGCDTGSYKLKTYTSNPVTCSTNYGDYNLTSPQTISSHLWVCGAAKDLAGNAGFSSPVEFKVDEIVPSTAVTNPAAGSWHNNDFTATIDDSDTGGSGLASSCQYLVVGLNPSGPDCSSGILSRSCDPVNKTVYVGSSTATTCSATNICIFQGENRCKVTTYAYDNAGNSKQTSQNFGIDWTKPQIGKIACVTPPTSCDPTLAPCTTAQEGIEKTFCASLTDPVGQITGCQLWVDDANSGVSTTISPIPCENGAACGVSANYTFTVSGSHQMKFYCWDAAGNSDFGQSVTVNVGANHPPTITAGPSYTTSPCTSPTTQPGCNVNFTISATDADNDTLIYNWDFGDGGTSTEQNPVHHYSTANTYTVTVTVSDGRGGTDSKGLTITVSNLTLSVDLCAGLDASLVCSDSPTFSSPANDVDLKATVSGTMYGTINYYFDCTNDGTWDLIVLNQTTESYTAKDLCDYPSLGTYTPKVFIERGTGSAEDTITTIKVIEDRAPSLSWTGEAGYTADGLEPETGTDSTNFVYKIKYTDLDDDSPNFVRVHVKKSGLETSGSPFNMSYQSGTYSGGAIYSFSKSGLVGGSDYTYFFEAQDNKGLSATPTSEIDAPDVNNPPTAAISCDASGCQPGGQCGTNWIAYNRNCIYKILNQSTDPDNNIKKSIWSIFYQDGTPWQDPYLTCDDKCDLTLPSLTAGQGYYVKLKVEDTGGLSSSTSHSFYVRQDAIADFECSLNGTDWQSCQGFKVSEDVLVYFRSLNGAFLSRPSEGASSITGFSWIFEDGTPTTSTLQNPSVNFKKVDANSGVANLTITDNVGRTDTQSYQLLITVPLPEWKEVPPL